jgi:hypothetical protein
VEEFAYRPLDPDGLWESVRAVPGTPHFVQYDSKVVDVLYFRDNCVGRDNVTLPTVVESTVGNYASLKFSTWVCGVYRADCSNDPNAPLVSTCSNFDHRILVASTSAAAIGKIWLRRLRQILGTAAGVIGGETELVVACGD